MAAVLASSCRHLKGKPYTNHHHFLFTVHDGQIVAVNEYMDTKHLHDVTC